MTFEFLCEILNSFELQMKSNLNETQIEYHQNPKIVLKITSNFADLKSSKSTVLTSKSEMKTYARRPKFTTKFHQTKIRWFH